MVWLLLEVPSNFPPTGGEEQEKIYFKIFKIVITNNDD